MNKKIIFSLAFMSVTSFVLFTKFSNQNELENVHTSNFEEHISIPIIHKLDKQNLNHKNSVKLKSEPIKAISNSYNKNATVENKNIVLQEKPENLQILDIRRIGIDEAEEIKNYLNDPSPKIRSEAISHYKELESEYELQKNIVRNDKQSGKFVPSVLEAMLKEDDPFVLDKAFDYIGEYAGRHDKNVLKTMSDLLQRDDLSVSTLSRLGELAIDNYDMNLEQTKEFIQKSPSIANVEDFYIEFLNKTFKSLSDEYLQQPENIIGL